MRNFKKLKVWQKSHQVVIDVYQITKIFPNVKNLRGKK